MSKAERISKLKKVCDELWSLYVRLRDGRCLMCGVPRKEKVLFAHHWFVQKARSLLMRWDVRNGATLCYRCHMKQVHEHATWVIIYELYLKVKVALGLSEEDVQQMGDVVAECVGKKVIVTEEFLLAKKDELERRIDKLGVKVIMQHTGGMR